jgi:hypothetical protein
MAIINIYKKEECHSMRKLKSSTNLVALLISTIAILVIWITSVNASVKITERSKLALNGIGPIRVGMTIDEASQAAGVKSVKLFGGFSTEYCTYIELLGVPKGINFMVTKNRIARVDISNKRISTIRGAKIGDTEDRIFSLYPGQIKATRHEYAWRTFNNAKYLTFVPKDDADKNYRIVFETSKNRVFSFHSGKLPEVMYIEGCL